jgi:integrase
MGRKRHDLFKEERRMLTGNLIELFLAYCSRHRSPATLAFYRARLKKFCEAYHGRDLATLTPLEIDEHLALVGAGMSDSTRHHNCVALERLQKFAVQNKLLDRPVFGILEKPRVGRRDRIPTLAETEAILGRASAQFRLIYLALRQCGARPGELCRTTIADVDRTNRVITLKEHKTARKTGQARRIPIGRLCGRPHNRPYVAQTLMWPGPTNQRRGDERHYHKATSEYS